jgi:hypothetical protein
MLCFVHNGEVFSVTRSVSIHSIASSLLLLASFAVATPIHATVIHYSFGDSLTARNKDVDLYGIWINDPFVFKSHTVQDKYWTQATDPQLFLFDDNGDGIDASDSTPFESSLNISQSIIDASVVDALTDPDLFGGLTASLYLLGISWSDLNTKYTNPDDANETQSFNTRGLYTVLGNSHFDPNGDRIADYVISGWGGAASANLNDKPQRINLEGAHFAAEALPEPGVMILLGAGLIAMGMIPRRKCIATAAA